MIKVIIVDDHPLVREGVKKVLNKDKLNARVAGEASDGDELFKLLENNGRPDVLVLDINMPGKNGLDIMKELRQNYPELPVLILSMHPADNYAVRSLKAGASGYLTKGSIPDVLGEAIDTVVNKKKKYISREVAEELANQVNDDSKQPRHNRLSDREYQVMCMIASGMKASEIAGELSLSIRTVHTYRKRMMEKLNLKTNVEIAHYALNNQLVENG